MIDNCITGNHRQKSSRSAIVLGKGPFNFILYINGLVHSVGRWGIESIKLIEELKEWSITDRV